MEFCVSTAPNAAPARRARPRLRAALAALALGVIMLHAAAARADDFERGVAAYRAGDHAAAAAAFQAAAGAGGGALALQRLGDALYADGDAAGALAAYKAAAQEDGDGAGLFRSLGNAAYALDEFDAALSAYSEAISVDPTDGRAALYRAWTREALGDWSGALADYDLAMETLGGSEPRAALDRGRLRRALGAPTLALEDFEAAAELSARAGDAAAAGDIALAALFGAAQALNDVGQPRRAAQRIAEARARAAQASPEIASALEPSLRFETGRAALAAREYSEAEATFSALLAERPQRADLLANRAVARLGLGDYAGALEDWNAASELRPRDAALRYGLVRTAIAVGARDIALEATVAAERVAAEEPTARTPRARTLLALDRPFAALGVLDGAVTLEAMKLRAAALRRLGRDQDALEAARLLAQHAPENPFARLIEAESLVALGDPRAARAALQAANDLGAAPADVARLAGDAWMAAARAVRAAEREAAYAQARRAYDLAVRHSNGAPRVLQRRAAALERLGELEPARLDLDRAIAARPQDPELRFARANVLKSLGACDAALTDFDAALSLRPENDQAMAARAGCRFSEGDVVGAVADYLASWF